MRFGVVKTPDWRNLILHEGSGLCERGCNESESESEEIDELAVTPPVVRDTLRHILFECEHLRIAREKWTRIIEACGGQWALNGMFLGRNTFLAVIGFLRETNLFRLLAY